MNSVLIDTNLLVYVYDAREVERQTRAQRLLDELRALSIGRLSVQALSEFFHVSTRRLSPPLTAAEAFDQVTLLAQVWPVFELTPLIALEAARGVRDHGLPYYDAQMWATARLNQVPILLSEDFQDGRLLEGVRFLNPLTAEFELAAWV
jgi:predicted nucleic acid-binding protein